MTETQFKKLRAAFQSFREHRSFFKEEIARNHTIMEASMFEELRSEVTALSADFPALLPQLNPMDSEFVGQYGRGYRANVLITYLNRAIGAIEAELSEEKTRPVIEQRAFSFLAEPALRKGVERDYLEIQRAYIADCWKSVLILSGSAIEAVLLDVLSQNRSAAISANSAPKRDANDLSRWGLSDLIKVAIELRLITAGAEKLSHAVRDYRNLIHPGNEIRSGLHFGQEEARIAIEVLHMLHRDLSP